MFLGSWLLNQRLWVPCEAVWTADFVSLATSEVNQKHALVTTLSDQKETLRFTNDLFVGRERNSCGCV